MTLKVEIARQLNASISITQQGHQIPLHGMVIASDIKDFKEILAYVRDEKINGVTKPVSDDARIPHYQFFLVTGGRNFLVRSEEVGSSAEVSMMELATALHHHFTPKVRAQQPAGRASHTYSVSSASEQQTLEEVIADLRKCLIR